MEKEAFIRLYIGGVKYEVVFSGHGGSLALLRLSSERLHGKGEGRHVQNTW